MADIENEKITLKTALIISTIVAGYIIEGCAIYFPLAADAEEAKKNAAECKIRIDNFNPDMVLYRISELDKKVQSNNDKADHIIELLSK